VAEAIMQDSGYYPSALDLYGNITLLHPTAQIWLVGHSLGGSLASLLGHTFSIPVVTFEAPAERLAARRLHLPLPPPSILFSGGIKTINWGLELEVGWGWMDEDDYENEFITHVYHTADPVAMGTCNGVLSFCAVGGFALETKCHTGQSIIFDTVGKAGWQSDVRTHSIDQVIKRVLVEDWDEHRLDVVSSSTTSVEDRSASGEMGGGWWPPWKPKPKPDEEEKPEKLPPVPERTGDCVDCEKWEFVQGEGDFKNDRRRMGCS